MDHKKVAKEHLLHLVFGFVFFLVIGAAAVALDLFAAWAARLGVSHFTAEALALSADILLVADLVLFFCYVIATAIELIKGMKNG